jgi:tRNA G37 N-methylase Trm5
VQAGEHVVDLFGGVAPFGIQAALRGATVDSIDLNPEAVALARRNVEENKVDGKVRLHEGDARTIAATLPPADHIAMNLPHGAAAFLDVAARLAKPGATVHYHEILRDDAVAARKDSLVRNLAQLGRAAELRTVREVRRYSAQEAHTVFDIMLA